MKILVTGATGLVGSHTARALAEAGHELRLLLRKTSKLTNLEGLDYERCEGDVTQPDGLEEAAKGCDAVCHTAGVASWSPLDADLVMRVNRDGTRNVLEAARRAGVKRALVTASVAAIWFGSMVGSEIRIA